MPYWAVGSHTWITHGTLTTLAGLTADLMYGFISPTGARWQHAASYMRTCCGGCLCLLLLCVN